MTHAMVVPSSEVGPSLELKRRGIYSPYTQSSAANQVLTVGLIDCCGIKESLPE